MRYRLAHLLRLLADHLDPTHPTDHLTPLELADHLDRTRHQPYTRPLDHDTQWRTHVTDYAHYIDDDDGEWRHGTYL